MLMWEELSRKEQLECMFWDAYKDAYGIRPRHISIATMTEAELEQQLARLSEIIEQQDRG